MFHSLISKIKKNKFTVLITVFVIGLIGITLGSALINSVLTLTGNTKVKENRWNIHFEFIDNINASHPNTDSNLDARITDATSKKENISFTTNFQDVGDYYEFDVYTWNEGTIDAMLDESNPWEFNIPTEYKNNFKYELNYADDDIKPSDTITYDTNKTKKIYNSKYDYSKTTIKHCDPLYKDSLRRIHVRVKYTKKIADLTTDKNINFNLKLNYVQLGKCSCIEDDSCPTPEKYLLRIRPNGGTYDNKTAETKIYLEEGEEYTLKTPSRELYNFTGWEVLSPTENGSYTITGNTFKMGHENVILQANWEQGDYVARIMNKYYSTIQDAFDDVDSKNWKDNTVWLLKDTTEYPVNTAQHAFIFNLDNHVVTGTIQNNKDSNITLINGIIKTEERLTAEQKEGKSLNKRHEAAVINYGKLNMGMDDPIVSIENSITLSGNEYGLLNFYDNGSKFNFYDGIIEGDTAIEVGYNKTPNGYYVFVDHNNTKNCQRAYLIPNPNRAVAKTTTKGTIYYYNMQDAINNVETYKKDNSNLTDNDYIITVTRDFEESYPLTVSSQRVFIDTNGKDISTGETITNNGYLKIYNTDTNKSTISSSVSIKNNKNLVIDNVSITSTTDDSVIENKANLTLSKTTITGNIGYGISNTDNGVISADNNTIIKSNNNYGLYNNSTSLNIQNATIYGLENNKTMSIGTNAKIYQGPNYLAILNKGQIDVNDGSIVAEDTNNYIIENRSTGTLNVNGGTISNKYNTIINSGIVNITEGNISSDNTTVVGSTVYVRGGNVSTVNGPGIDATDVYVYGGTISSTNGNAIEATNAYVYGGTVTSENAKGVNASKNVTVEGGNIHGATYGVYGNIINIKDGQIDSDNIGVYAYKYYIYNTPYPGITKMTGGNVAARQLGLETDDFTMTSGTIVSENETGVNINQSGNITGGTIIGEIYGVHNKGTLTIGKDEGTISTEDPLIIGKSYGLYINDNSVTNFYDGILKGTIDGYAGVITGTPVGAIVTDGEDTIDGVHYETDYLISYKNWLKVGDNEFNTINAASSYIQQNGNDGDTIEVFDNAPDLTFRQEFVEGNKTVNFDLAGFSLTTTQPIVNNGNNTKIIDTSSDNKGTIITKKNISILNNVDKNLIIDGGNYVGHTKYALQNDGNLTIENAKYNVDDTAIFNRASLIINNININSSKNGIENNVNLKDGRTEVIISQGSITMNAGTINATNYGIYSNSNYTLQTTINGGTINAAKRGISILEGGIIVNGGTITADSEYAIYNYKSSTVINDGTIKANNDIAIFMAHPLTVNGGSITGKTYGVYTDQYCDAFAGSCGYPQINVTGGHIIGQTKDGIRTLGSELIVTGGIVEGKLDGINSDAETYIGKDEGSISKTSPVLIGHTKYALETTAYTGFFDGILKARINPDDGINDVYKGLISIIPTGSVITEDFEYINRVKYDTKYLDTKDNWLQIGDDESRRFNSLNAASAAMRDGDTTIKVIYSAYIDFKQEIKTDKDVIFDLNGHSVILTQPIVNETKTTVIDSGENGYLNNIRDIVIINRKSLILNSGHINSETDYTIENNDSLTVNGGNITSQNTAINNNGIATINAGTVTGSDTGIISRGTLTVKDGEITGTRYGLNVLSSDATIDGGHIKGKNGIYVDAGRLIVNDGTIDGTSESAITNDDSTIINGGTIIASNSSAIRNIRKSLTINGGKITSLTSNGIDNEGLWYNAASLVVNDGEITGYTNGINNINAESGYNSVIINGGKIVGQNSNGMRTNSLTKILGGTLIGKSYGVYCDNNYNDRYTQIGEDDGNINVDTPVLRGDLYGIYVTSNNLYFYDGILKGITERINDYEKISKIPEGSEIIFDSEVIDEKTYLTAYLLSEQEIARILTKNKECTKQSRITQDENKYCIYNNLQSAIDDADDGETIQILETARTIPIYYDVTINKNITLDLNGKTITTTKNIVNEAETKIIDSTKTNGTLKTSSANYLITNRNSLICEDVKLINSNTRNYVIHSIAPLSLKNINVSAVNGIYCSDTLTINNSSIITSSTAIDARGKVTINGGNYRGGSYSIYMDTNSDSEIKNVTLTGVFYNSGSNNTSMKNSTITGTLNNYANMTILKGDTPTILRNGFDNYGTIEVNEANVIGNVRNNGTTTINKSAVRDGRITNTRLFTINDSEFSISIKGYNYDSIDYALYNTGTFNMNNTKTIIRAAKYSLGLDNSGTFNMNENSEISITGGTNTYGIRNKGTGKVNISSGNIIVSGNDKAFGIYSTGENAKVTMVSGKVNVTAPTSYGAYLKYGTFEMGVKEVGENAGTQYADVSLTNPLINSHGTNGIGIKKESGFFNYYDGIIWGSKYAKPEVVSNIEYKWEATTYIDEESGYEYTILEYMPNDYQQEEICILRGVAYQSVTDALARANDGDVIKLVRSTTESFEIPSGKNVIINLNKNTITGKITNNGTVNIYNGTLTNHNDSVLINNQTFIMGDSSDRISSANIRIISDKTAVVNNGQFNMYDGYIEGNPSINGSINTIPPLSRIRTTDTGQSERKSLQSLDRDSIINGDTDLIITIDPNSGYYDERNVIQEVYLKHNNSYDLMTNHTIRKNGCEFDGWEVSDETAYDNGVITVDLSDINVKAKWKVKDTTVAQIGNEYYDTLADAIFHAKKGDKVILLKDTVEDITNNKDITIDLNEHKVTGAFVNTANLSIINGTIENTAGIAIVNNKSLVLGRNDGDVSTNSVKVIGTTEGIEQNGSFALYDGYIEGNIALNGKVDKTPQGYYLYNERVVDEESIKQRVYLIGNPENAVAETREGGIQYFFNLNDAIATSTVTGYEIFIRKDFDATYEIESTNENADIVINLEGHTINTSNPITNKEKLKIYDTAETKGEINTASTINNSGTLIIELPINELNSTNKLIESTGKLTINNTKLTSKNGNAITSSGSLAVNNSIIEAQEGYAVYSTGSLELNGDYELNSTKYALYNEGQELTLNHGIIHGMETTKNVTIEDGMTIVGNSGYNALAGKTTCDIVINGGTVTAGSYGVTSSGANSNITLNGGKIIGGSYGLYCNGSDNKITINGGTVENSYHGVWLNSTKCNFEMNDGEVLATHYGLVDQSTYNTVVVNGGTLSGTNMDGIIENTSRSTSNNQVAFPKVTINGGLVVGGRYGIYNQFANVYIKGGEVKSVNNYAVYLGAWSSVELRDNGFVNSINSYGIYSDSCVYIYGGKIHAGGAYGVYNNYTCFTMTGGEIETTNASSSGVRINGTNTISGGEIKSANIGILNNNSSTLNIYGNTKITGDTYGISQTSSGTINIGRQADEYSTTTPYITGGLYGIYKSNGTVNFYNGKLRGYTNGYNGTISNIRKNMDIVTEYEDEISDEKITTYSTPNVSSTPQSNSAKSGSGYARITYIGETNDTCENGQTFNFDYKGSEDTFTSPCAGTYKLEVWGAQGGSTGSLEPAGYGGYSTGEITLSNNEKLYINVGGQGSAVYGSSKLASGGYNGGGQGSTGPLSRNAGGGGGATHIATQSGKLSTLENNKDSVLIVAGGGGGTWNTGSEWQTKHSGNGGGYKGGTSTGYGSPYNHSAKGGTQESGYAFGQGQNAPDTSNEFSGGGGGYYGGYINRYAAGGGSGYIANDRLSNAYMYGYNVEPTSWVINYLAPKDAFLRVGEQTFNNFEDATDAIDGEGTIYLLKDVSLTEEVTFPTNATITFDLQGNTLGMTKAITSNSNLTITSTGSETKGKIYTNGAASFNIYGNMTVNDAIIESASNSTLIPRSNITININGTSEIKSGYCAISYGGAATVNLNSGSIISTGDYGIHFNALANSKLNVYDGTISSNNYAIISSNATGVETKVEGGTITGKYGIDLNGANNVTTISGGTIIGTSAGIYNSNSGNMSTLNITGGNITGATAVYVARTNATVSGGTFNATGTANNNYILQVANGTSTITGGEFTGNGSGINITGGTVKDITINSKGNNGSGIIASGTVELNNVKVNTTGASSYGISGSPILSFKNSTINSKNIGINITGGTTNIISGTITGENTGIIINGSGATLNMGEADKELSIEKPYVTGGTYAINNQAGSFNFYNGRLRGKTFGYTGTLNSIRKGKQVYTEYEADYTIPNATLSTDNVSSDPISKYAKSGNGYARITYVGQTNDTCENGTEYNFDYKGSEDTFNVPCTGEYKLEVWGAQGGNSKFNSVENNGGYGGYSTGTIELTESDTLYINVGGKGTSVIAASTFDESTGYNGGGYASYWADNSSHGGGGGATHIAKNSGLLSTFESNKESVIIVAGGGGGASTHIQNPDYSGTGGSGGGYIGGRGITSSDTCYDYGTGGTQTGIGTFIACSNNVPRNENITNSAGFGLGANYSSNVNDSHYTYAGGGSGWYGGESGHHGPGGGGSGYTGYSELKDSVMYGYQVDTTDVYVINYLTTKAGFLEVNDEVYNSFEEAIAAIEGDSGTIKVLNGNSVQEEVTFPEGKTITLDLNGKTLNMTKTIINNSDLTITDSTGTNEGTITNGSLQTIYNHNNLTIEKVKIENTTSDKSVIVTYSNTINIKNDSILKTNSYAINAASDSTAATTINMEGGTITSSQNGVVLNYANSSFNMTGGKIEVSKDAMVINVPNTEIKISDGDITAGNFGVYIVGTNCVVDIDDSKIDSKGSSIYFTTANNSISIDNSELKSETAACVNLQGNNAIAEINNSTIIGKTYGVYNSGQVNKIIINNSDISATEGEGFRENQSSSTRSTINIKGGTITGTTNGMYVKNTDIILDNVDIKTTSTKTGNYALYQDGNTNYSIEDNTFINAPTASGLYLNGSGNIIDSKIYSGANNGNAIGGIWFSGFIRNSEISAPKGYGINGGSENKFNLTLDDSTINAGNIGISLTSSSTANGAKYLNINGSSIIGSTYGIYQTQNYTTTIGSLKEENNQKIPYIEGGINGLYKTNGTINFYSGRVKGFTSAYSGSINNIRDGYEIYETNDELISKKQESLRTISTTNVSESAESNKAKLGTGYAKITYVGNGDKVIKLTNDYNEPTDCSSIVGRTYSYDALKIDQVFSTKCAGTYKLEVWGAQGGYHSSSYPGGYGGYSTGTIELTKNQKLFINIGGAGSSNYTKVVGGYNGGGNGTGGNCSSYRYSSSGGGATHIATSSGLLSSLENKKNSILIVAGGGGGSQEYSASIGAGASAGGYKGNTATWTNNGHRYYIQPTGGTQESGGLYGCSYTTCTQSVVGSFGQGGNYNGANCSEGSGGGGGYYGGGSGSFTPGAGGSGFINNNSLNNKSMYCYGCQESSDVETFTVSTTGNNELADKTACPNGYSSSAISKCAKAGNGYARITLLELASSENKVTVNFISEKGTIETKTKELVKGSEIGTLETPTTSSNIIFDGWYQDPSYKKKIDSSFIVDKSMNIYAKYKYNNQSTCSLTSGTEYLFDYKGSEDTFEIPCTGEYKLEVWGGSGGNVSYGSNNSTGGYGGYASGKINLKKDNILYINVGGTGAGNTGSNGTTVKGGYNGGGACTTDSWGYCASSGGATHIATSSGLLSSLKDNKESVIIVAGGGGAGGVEHGSRRDSGGSGGGYIGGTATTTSSDAPGSGGTQESGYAFGQGSNIGGWWGSTGGGWYGGNRGSGGGGGSGYAGHTDLYDTIMYGYNVPTIYSNVPAQVIYLVKEGEYLENTTTNETYSSLQTALDEANEGETIRLTRDGANNVEFSTDATNVTIDLNGYNLNMMKSITNNGNIKITNSNQNNISSISSTLTTNAITNNGILNIDNISTSLTQFISNGTNGTLNIENSSITTTSTAITNSGNMTIKDSSINSPIGINNNNADSELNLDTVVISSSNQAIVNTGSMTITKSQITGTNYAIYDNGTKESSITNSTLSSSSTGIYNYSTAKIEVNTTDITGQITNTKTNGTIKITGDTENKNTITGTVFNTGNMEYKFMNIKYVSDNSGQDQAISNSGILTIKNSNITYQNTYTETNNAQYSNQGSLIIRNTGTITSTNSKYKIYNDNNKLTKHLSCILNDSGIVNLTNDDLEIINGYIQVGIYSQGSHTTTLNNTNINIDNTYTKTAGYGMALSNQASTMNVTGGIISVKNAYSGRGIFTAGNLTSNGVQYNISGSNDANLASVNISNSNYSFNSINDKGTINGSTTSYVFSIVNGKVNVTNGEFTSTSNTTAYGVNMTNGTFNMISGNMKATAPTAYGIKATGGTITLGEAETDPDKIGTENADVSITDPHIEANGTTTGIGISFGESTFNYYDGIIIGSTSARVSGEIPKTTEKDYHIVNHTDVDNNKYYCILEYDK